MKFPPLPGELMFALSVNVADLRPWEWWQMDSEEYSLIVALRGAWESEQKAERADLARDQPDV